MSPEEQQEEQQHFNPSHDHTAKAAGKNQVLSGVLINFTSQHHGRIFDQILPAFP